MRSHYKFFLTIFLFLHLQTPLFAQSPHFVDFKYVLNQSKAGKEAQAYLKKKLDNGIKGLKSKEKSIQEEEKKIIQQKKLVSAEDYKKKVTQLREKVSSLQIERDKLLDSVSKQRAKARTELLKNLNPIIKDYPVTNICELTKKSIIKVKVENNLKQLFEKNLENLYKIK